mmetsp:Transcript_123866/g.263982  ORF Transcript_123866/g.263982 Transcript_123866/m.263982 type:complete len:549 (+) Transcript_123866:44-1690(+)
MADAQASAKQHLAKGELAEAREKASQAREQFLAARNVDGVVDAMGTLVAVAIAQRKPRELQPLVGETMEQMKAVGSIPGYGGMSLAAAELFLSMGETDKALKLVGEALQLNLPQLAVKGLSMKCKILLEKGAGQEMMAASQDLLTATQEAKDQVAEAEAWLSVASAHHLQEEDSEHPSTPANVLVSADKAVDIYKTLGDKRGIATATTTCARAYLRKEQTSSGVKAAQESIAIWHELGETGGVALAVETLIDAYWMTEKAEQGLKVANLELEWIRTLNDKKGEAEMLEVISNTHAMLGEPFGAMSSAKQAMFIYWNLGDRLGQGRMLLTMSEIEDAQGKKADATKLAEDALKHFQAARHAKWIAQALKNISSLLVERGMPEKAPTRPEAKKVLALLGKAIEMRKDSEVKALETELNDFGDILSEEDLGEVLLPIFQKDPEAVEWLKEQGWEFQEEKSGTKTRMVDMLHKLFYMTTIWNAMGFGPQFRVNHSVRCTNDKDHNWAISVCQLPNTEAWQESLGFRPAFLDGGIQHLGLAHSAEEMRRAMGF